jgi:SAM-dependent methyltransferase
VTDRGTQRDYLARVQYATDANLAARQSIYRFQQPPRPLTEFVFGLIDIAGDERVIDVGCGNGMYLAELALRNHGGGAVGLDLSPGMHPHVVGDAQHLPFADAEFDLAFAMHMLYHVPDRAAAIAELRRVVRPGGTVLVVTNARDHLRELNELLGVDARVYVSFSCENAQPELEDHFGSVERHDAQADIIVPELAPLLDYVQSMKLSPEVADRFRPRADAIIRREGAMRIGTHVCCFVCR